MASHNPNPAKVETPDSGGGIPGSASQAHPRDGIPLPAHGFETLDFPVRELATIPAADAISRAAVMLISATAEKLGLTPGEEPDIDLDDARLLIDALAGLFTAARAGLGSQAEPLQDGLRTLQRAFREASVHPDEPGQGPGEALLP